MRVRFDIECTPEEARGVLGLPDVSPVHDEAMKVVRRRMSEAFGQMDSQELLRRWLPAGIHSWTQLQDLFWQQVCSAAGGRRTAGARGRDEDEENR